MKRMIAGVLAAFTLFGGAACAQTLREQVNAPDRVQAVYANATGNTVFTIDAAVIVPDVPAAYMIPVKKTFATEADLDAMCAYLWPGVKFRNMNDGYTEKYYSYEYFYRLYTSKTPDIRIDARTGRSLYKDGVVMGGSISAEIQYDAEYRRKKTPNYWVTSPCALVAGEGIEGHALTSAEAVAVMQRAVDAITRNAPFALANLGMGPGTIYDDSLMADANAQWAGTPYSYVGVFTRVAEGMPLQPVSHEPYRRDTDTYVSPVGYERIVVNLGLEGQIVKFSWTNPCEIAGEREECALLPFSQILGNAAAILPLTQAMEEKYQNGKVRIAIDRIQLGLLAVLQPYDIEVCKLTPVWVFYGWDEGYAHNLSADRVNRAFFAVNAVTGMAVDLEYGY